jgi:hypothetical protein
MRCMDDDLYFHAVGSERFGSRISVARKEDFVPELEIDIEGEFCQIRLQTL